MIITAAASGRLLGHATHSPHVVEVLEDLLAVGEGLDIMEKEVGPDQVGPLHAMAEDGTPVLAVVRDGELLRYDDPRAQQVEAGDKVICLCSN